MKKEGSVSTRLADHTLLQQGRRYPEARDLRWTKVRVLFTRHDLLQQTIFECTATPNSMRDGPMDHGFVCGDGSSIDWHQRHVRVFSALYPLAV